jgi:competence protein ComEC
VFPRQVVSWNSTSLLSQLVSTVLLAWPCAFVVGAFLVQLLPALPDPFCLAFVPIAAFCLMPQPGAPRWVLVALLGAAWACGYAQVELDRSRAVLMAGPEVVVTGRIGFEVREYPGALGFELLTDTVAVQALTARIKVRWYRTRQRPRAGERWQLRLKVKALKPRFNPGGFDRVGWSFRRGVVANAYVREGDANQRLRVAQAGVGSLRRHLGGWIRDTLGERPAMALVQALGVGYRSAITQHQWALLRSTGTAHLMAISGLHVGLVAGLAFFMSAACWRYAGTLPERFAAPRVAAIVGLAAALSYASLAGWSLPTQRAAGMCAVAFFCIATRYRLGPGHALLITLALVAAWHPPSLTDPSLWLSAGAVLALLFGMREGSHLGRLGQLLRVQWVAALGLAPLGLLVFGSTPGISPLANLVAVPVVALCVVPLTLLALGLSQWTGLAGALLELAASLLDLTWVWITWCHEWRVPVPLAVGAEVFLVAMVVGVVLLLSRLPGRWVGLLWLLPATFGQSGRLPPGEFELTVFDVGQGLSVLVRTARHATLYDTGGAFGQFSVARNDLTPALRRLGITTLDHLIVSHADLDHAGGARAIIDTFHPRTLLGRPRAGLERRFEPCRRGQSWVYDAVSFEVLHPERGNRASRNNGSCVVRIRSQSGQRVLLTGDIEARAEQRLLQYSERRLRSEVIVVPHHGSRTSSTAPFINAVRPQIAIVSAGLRNRFAFPHREVALRYARGDVAFYNTASAGAVQVRSQRDHLAVTQSALAQWRYWHAMTCEVASAKLAAANAFRVEARRCWN